MRTRTRRDDGQVLPLVALLVALVGVVCLLLGRVAGATVARASAATAADAAALAGAVDGRAAAAGAARANGGRLLRFTVAEGGTEVEVEVAVGPAHARARARTSGVPGGIATVGLAPGLRAALARAEALLGGAVPVTSGFRTRAEQERLWRNRAANAFPVAAPGTSRHEQGLAVDVPLWFVPRLLNVAARAGLCQPLPQRDPVHFELCPSVPRGSGTNE